MENSRIEQAFAAAGERKLVSIFFTAGYPERDSTLPVLQALQDAGADMVEVGIPFSDPLADGAAIQDSSQQALANGMSLRLLFAQLAGLRPQIHLPVVLMGYLNPVLQYGMEAFCADCARVGADGVILPDLPIELYARDYRPIFERHGLRFICLVTPQTSTERLRQIEALSSGFIYAVSSASTTGSGHVAADSGAYLARLADLRLRLPLLTGFNIRDRASFEAATAHTAGGIVGSAFVRLLAERGTSAAAIGDFVRGLRG